jgi:hypothetical protein
MSYNIFSAAQGTIEFNTIKKILLSQTNGVMNASSSMCQGKIDDVFLKYSLDNAQYLFANYYYNHIIGFASVMFHYDENNPSKTYLYIDLICNAPPNPSTPVNTINKKGAKDMINSIEELGRQLGCDYIKLNAIDSVIPYYFKLGFNFVTVYNNKGEEINQYLHNKASNLIKELRNSQMNDDTHTQEKSMITIIQRFYPGYLSEKSQKNISEIGINRTSPSRDGGIPMIKHIITHTNNNNNNTTWDNQLQGGIKTKKYRKHISKNLRSPLTSKNKQKQRKLFKKSRKICKQNKYYTKTKRKSKKLKK